MDEQDKMAIQYLVPANVSTKFEFFEGFGWQELKYVVIAIFIGGMLFLPTGYIKKTVIIEELPLEVQMGIRDASDFKETSDGKYSYKEPYIAPPIRFLIFIIIPTASAYFAVKRDPSTGMSLIGMLQNKKKFEKSQKRYLYKFGSGSEGK